jgi:hypothetical protein
MSAVTIFDLAAGTVERGVERDCKLSLVCRLLLYGGDERREEGVGDVRHDQPDRVRTPAAEAPERADWAGNPKIVSIACSMRVLGVKTEAEALPFKKPRHSSSPTRLRPMATSFRLVARLPDIMFP